MLPLVRIRHILDDARPHVIIDEEVVAVVDRWCAERADGVPGLAELDAGNAAYVIYTSGSTGAPKGRGDRTRLPRSVSGLDDRRVSRDARGVGGPDLDHLRSHRDRAVHDARSGGCVHLLSLSDYDQRDTERLRHSPCTFLKVTPSHLAVLGQLADELSPMTELLLGGEALFGSMLARWRAAHPAVSVLNVYGPTEATVNCSEHRIEPGVQIAAGPVPLGVAQPGNRLAVLDNDLRPVGQGGTGGLYVGGSGLARGYLRCPSLTAARFLPDPAGPPGARRYWTGDLVRADADDRLTFVGRADDQVKVRGFRVSWVRSRPYSA